MTEYDAPFVVCIHCGMNLRTRRVEKPEVTREEDDEENVGPSGSRRAAVWVAEYLPGLFRPVVLVVSILLGIVGLAICAFAVSLVFVGLLLGSIGAASVGGVAYAQAVAWFLTGEFRMLVDALVDFDSTRWMIFAVLLFLPGTILIIIAAQGVT
jgi:hypothetical protein